MRTTLLDADGKPKYTNRLIDESSPYLVQHAHNPVDWYPWGTEAFAKAREENKPVFLSIGYSTCHWCHVMEHESFDNESIADYLNQHFVSIKLDREQRPDLDDIYMTGVQMLTGQGGWPMSNFLTPEGKPFFAGTYFPPQNFANLLQQIANVWRDRRDEVEKQANEIATGISQYTSAKGESRALGDNLVGRVAAELLGRLDEENGGFGGAPKFPNESMLLALLEDWERNRNTESMRALTLSLDKMYQGGICDQVAGGFHRYTVDAIWLVPHFEKMLYNQAQLVRVYARAAALTRSFAWTRVVERTIAYVLRDMTDDEGRFFSATDADSEGEEGLFFLWTPAELIEVLGPDDAAFVTDLYGVTDDGNFEGRTILNLPGPIPEDIDVIQRLDDILGRLYVARETREHPLRDEKVITAWNGMMITSLAHAGSVLDRDDYLSAARTAAASVWRTAWIDGSLSRIIYRGERSIPGNLEDYAYLAEAMLTLYQVTAEDVWLTRGKQLVAAMIARFADAEEGGFFLAVEGDEGPMITRPRSPMDGATASGNSVALNALVLLFEVTGDVAIEGQITSALRSFGGLLQATPSAFAYMLIGAERYLRGHRGRVQFAGDGAVRVVARQALHGYRLTIALADGWHINASDIADASLVATRVVTQPDDGDARVVYPAVNDPEYSGTISIDIEGDVDEIAIELQPCSGELCLSAETLLFSVR